MKCVIDITKEFRNSDRGIISLFFSAVCIPLLILLLCLSLDLASYFERASYFQDKIDETALLAARNLPIKEKAREIVVRSTSELGTNVKYEITGNKVRLSAQTKFHLSFSDFFGSISIPILNSTDAGVLPLKASIIVDSSAGDSKSPETIPSWFKNELSQEEIPINSTRNEIAGNCIDASFLNIKNTALVLHDYLSAKENSDLLIGFSPGVPKYGSSGEILGDHNLFLFNSNNPIFPEYESNVSKDRWCLASAERETANDQFKIPKDVFTNEYEDGYTVFPPLWNKVNVAFLTTRKIIWSKSRINSEPSDISNVIKIALLRIIDRGALNILSARPIIAVYYISDKSPENFKTFNELKEPLNILSKFQGKFSNVILSIGVINSSISDADKLKLNKIKALLNSLAVEYPFLSVHVDHFKTSREYLRKNSLLSHKEVLLR